MSKEVVVYTSNTCGYCKMVKEYLQENEVEYSEKNISDDQEARKKLISEGFMSVPIIYIGDEVVKGFDKKKLSELLDL